LKTYFPPLTRVRPLAGNSWVGKLPMGSDSVRTSRTWPMRTVQLLVSREVRPRGFKASNTTSPTAKASTPGRPGVGMVCNWLLSSSTSVVG
jgi:hypothetical protein